jgi:hypothetical protein
MPDADISEERLQAIRVRDALHRMIAKLNQGKPTMPSELSVWIRKSGPRVSRLFLWMACTAVAGKYQQAEKHDVASWLLQLRLVAERLFFANDTSWDGRQQMHDAARTLQAYFHGRIRISQHQSRWLCSDLDIALCSGAAFSADLGITPWVCQQPDLRYRWTDGGIARLAYLADCWDGYANIEPTWADRMIGLPNFPTYPEYC